jgi:hypothetical protein
LEKTYQYCSNPKSITSYYWSDFTVLGFDRFEVGFLSSF